MMLMRRSQSRPRTRLSRSISGSAQGSRWGITLSLAAVGFLLLGSVVFLQVKLASIRHASRGPQIEKEDDLDSELQLQQWDRIEFKGDDSGEVSRTGLQLANSETSNAAHKLQVTKEGRKDAGGELEQSFSEKSRVREGSAFKKDTSEKLELEGREFLEEDRLDVDDAEKLMKENMEYFEDDEINFGDGGIEDFEDLRDDQDGAFAEEGDKFKDGEVEDDMEEQSDDVESDEIAKSNSNDSARKEGGLTREDGVDIEENNGDERREPEQSKLESLRPIADAGNVAESKITTDSKGHTEKKQNDSFYMDSDREVLRTHAQRSGSGSDEINQSKEDKGYDAGETTSAKNLERLGQIRTVPRWVPAHRKTDLEDQRNNTDLKINPVSMDGNATKEHLRKQSFWDNLLGLKNVPSAKGNYLSNILVARKYGLNVNSNGQQRQAKELKQERGQTSLEQRSNPESSEVNMGGSVSAAKHKGIFSSDDEPLDVDVQRKLEELVDIEDALFLNKETAPPKIISTRSSTKTSSKTTHISDSSKREKAGKAAVDLLNPLNNPLLQDPDMIGPGGLTRNDRAILKALRKTSFDDIPSPNFWRIKDNGEKGSARMLQDSSDLKRLSIIYPRQPNESATDALKAVDDTIGHEDDNKREKSMVGNTFKPELATHNEVATGQDNETPTSGGTPYSALNSKSHYQEKNLEGSGFANLMEVQVEEQDDQEEMAEEASAEESYETSTEESHRRWGSFPGMDSNLRFFKFMDIFLDSRSCQLKVFMAWTTPPWSFSVRHQRGLESLFHFHPQACVVVFSESIELDFFREFFQEGYGGVYLDFDVIILREFTDFRNTVGLENFEENWRLNGAVMAFERRSPFLEACLVEYTATYDDKLLSWNGADLLTRISNRQATEYGRKWVEVTKELHTVLPTTFFPIKSSSIHSYFTVPAEEDERQSHVELLDKILQESSAFHFWNSVTAMLVPETGSLVERVINHFCTKCADVI
ncbi:hypothetical protein O6H91_18G065500 [Diphasiastrum complanatum]|uniref:Uncharacterized protein n=1 Tax=Diphasiastrum complanatum TaxID=34168 RepID=A0ACC2B264_DIPCM|nr:hypothetical protein O6H91_18G065500 [Diphasiastrum complanatum]